MSTLPQAHRMPFARGASGSDASGADERSTTPFVAGTSHALLDARRALLAEMVRLPRPPRRYFAVKRTIDLAVTIGIGLVTLPLWLGIAAAIKLYDRGPVFFAQQRTGLGGRRFRMLKFRTMCPDAEERKAELRHLSLVAYPDFKMENDPRVTPVGKLLRAAFLDELPQLINVIRGEMSLVGPRPTSFAASTYSLWHTERLVAKPGITGLWQVRRAEEETSFDERLRLDVEYLRNRSIRGDLRIMLETVTSTFRRSGK
jgi:lipopolysaccharide/colanic/teichoic acid biosynthesis glycosyltransferase